MVTRKMIIRKNKKAEGLTLETIVIAVLVLIVLAILIYIFSSKMGGVQSGLESCNEKGGVCEKTDSAKFNACNGPTMSSKDDACGKCCIPLIDTTKK